MLRVWVGTTGPVIRGRAGRTPLPRCPRLTIRFPYAAPFDFFLCYLVGTALRAVRSPTMVRTQRRARRAAPYLWTAVKNEPRTKNSIALTLPLPTCQLVNGPASYPFWPTEPLSLRASSVPLVPVSPCQHVPSRKRVSPCHLAHVSPRDLWSRSGRLTYRS